MAIGNLCYESLKRLRIRIFKHISASVRLIANPLVKVAGLSMDYFAIPVVAVLHDLCIMKGKITNENPVNLLCGRGKSSYWKLDTFENSLYLINELVKEIRQFLFSDRVSDVKTFHS